MYPALATAERFRQARPNAEILFVGTHTEGLETRLIPAAGYRLALIAGVPLFGQSVLRRPAALSGLVAGWVEARKLLRRERIDLVIGYGGYASAGALLAAWSLHLPRAIVECNATPGLVNQLLWRGANAVFVGFEETRRHFPGRRTRTTGVPIRREITDLNGGPTAPPTADRPLKLLVLGGSQGSAFLNRRAPELAEHLARKGIGVIARHQVGTGDRESVETTYAGLGITAEVTPFIEDMAAAYASADFALTVAGANTLWELAIAGMPSVLVPLEAAARDHQAANARAFARATRCPWIRERDWDPEPLAERVAGLIRAPHEWRKLSERVKSIAVPDAARQIVAECESLLAKRKRKSG